MSLGWGAAAALTLLGLLGLAAAPHFHDAADARDETCVPCHVHGLSLIASDIPEAPAPEAAGSPHARAQGRVRDAAIEGHGSRAPPA